MINSNRLLSHALSVPAIFTDNHPFLFSGSSFWTSPSGFPKLVNLALFVGILIYLLRKPVSEFFRQRFAGVRETLERAAREKEAATAKMAELDARLTRLDTELAEIKSQAQHEAEAERQRVQAEAARDIEKLRMMAQREVDAARQIALADLREFAATKSVDLAEQIIKRELKPEDDARLLQRAGENISNLKS